MTLNPQPSTRNHARRRVTAVSDCCGRAYFRWGPADKGLPDCHDRRCAICGNKLFFRPSDGSHRTKNQRYYRRRSIHFQLQGLTTQGDPRRRDRLPNGHRRHDRARLRRNDLAYRRRLQAAGLTTKGRPRIYGLLPPSEAAWRAFRAPFNTTAPDFLYTPSRDEL